RGPDGPTRTARVRERLRLRILSGGIPPLSFRSETVPGRTPPRSCAHGFRASMTTARQGGGEEDSAEQASRFVRQVLDLDPDEVAMLVGKLEHTRVRGPKGSSFSPLGAAVCLILEGWLVRSVMLPDGRRQILDFLVPGDIVGVLPAKRTP